MERQLPPLQPRLVESQHQHAPHPPQQALDSGNKNDKKPAKRQIVIVACNSCRRRKLKCTAERPTCSSCAAKDLPCIYEADPNATRNATLKRRHATLQEIARQLTDVVDVIRYSSQPEVTSVVTRLRNGEEVSTILEHARQKTLLQGPTAAHDFAHDARRASHDVTEGQSAGSEQSSVPSQTYPDIERWRLRLCQPQQDQRMKMDALVAHDDVQHSSGPASPPQTPSENASQPGSSQSANLLRPLDPIKLHNRHSYVDERLARVSSERWTMIKISDAEMATLISSYLASFHKQQPLFNEARFLQNLVSETTDNPTMALVNAICCYTCTQIYSKDSHTRFLKPLFHEHTRRLLDLCGQPTTNALAATTIMAAIEVTEGGSKAQQFLDRARTMARELGIVDEHGMAEDGVENTSTNAAQKRPAEPREVLHAFRSMIWRLSSYLDDQR